MIKIKRLEFLSPVVIIALFLLGSCNDDSQTEKEKLPPATQTGENTFGCLVDGKAWVAETSIDAWAFYQSGVLSISAQLNNNQFEQGISLGLIDNNVQNMEYQLTEYPNKFGQLGDFRNNCGYLTSSTHLGKLIIIHFDQTNFIISGTFEFEGYSDDCLEIIKITEGRFDLHYAP